MAEISLSREAFKAPEWQKKLAVAQVQSILQERYGSTVSAARIESIAWDAEALRVSTDVRITPVLTNVNLEFKVADAA